VTPAELAELEQLQLKAERISASFHARVAELAVCRSGARETGLRENGLALGWSDARLDPRFALILLRKSRGIRDLGRSYESTLNGQPFAVLPSGRIVVYDEGAR
jgi:hypothetical protein